MTWETCSGGDDSLTPQGSAPETVLTLLAENRVQGACARPSRGEMSRPTKGAIGAPARTAWRTVLRGLRQPSTIEPKGRSRRSMGSGKRSPDSGRPRSLTRRPDLEAWTPSPAHQSIAPQVVARSTVRLLRDPCGRTPLPQPAQSATARASPPGRGQSRSPMMGPCQDAPDDERDR